MTNHFDVIVIGGSLACRLWKNWTRLASATLIGVGRSARDTVDQIVKYISENETISTIMTPAIRPFVKDDWKLVSEIYRQGLLTRNATFETEVPDYDSWLKKFDPCFIWVAVMDRRVAGWAGLQPVSARQVYRE